MYITHYKIIKAFEPAEGGYYYPVADWDFYYKVPQGGNAADVLDEIFADLQENDYTKTENGIYSDNDYYVIENILGENVLPYRTYC
ncbi:MAG: hypothetical protein NC253_05375 [Ruminococcus sp.]|nr:hypothetical protein [Ruminococcus sp.]MCM1381802.1 hypothetical protein [Muribaculaceae bacterium]MCM1478260.1 hypothetical protein [Muribaculaceae bacterium]